MKYLPDKIVLSISPENVWVIRDLIEKALEENHSQELIDLYNYIEHQHIMQIARYQKLTPQNNNG